MSKIVTFGEMLLRLSSTNGERIAQAQQFNCHYGGAEANVAVALAHFGHDAYFVSKLPDNPLGVAAKRHLQANAVYTDYLLTGGERLGTYYLETGVGERSSQVTYDRKYSSITTIKWDDLDFDRMFQDADIFHVSGITPALSPELQEITLKALQKAHEDGVITSFDFNYRSKLWSQQEAGKILRKLLPYVTICSCSALDAIYLLGIEEADESLTKEKQLIYYYEKIQQLYPNIKYLCSTFREVYSASHHALQGNFYMQGSLYQSKVHQLNPIIDRVGGGDAFMSGILLGVLEQMTPDKTVSFATAASALKHTVHGDCITFTKQEVLSFMDNHTGAITR